LAGLALVAMEVLVAEDRAQEEKELLGRVITARQMALHLMALVLAEAQARRRF
jgi:hypothetical protein